MVVFPLLLLLFSFHGILSDHGTDIRQVEMLEDEFFMDTNAENREKAFVRTLDGLLHGNEDGRSDEKDDFSPGHVVEHATDDEQLDLVMEVFPSGPFNKTGQLRYSSVPLLEDDLIHEILDVIYSRDEYVRLLNDPDFDEMYGAVQEMIRIPTQKVLKQQLFHKILASRAWYTKYFDPMLNDNKRQKLLDFGHHLLDAQQNGTLSTRDMLEYNKQLQNFAFFDREDDKEFRDMMEKLIVVFDDSTKIRDGGGG
ncbi:Protein CBG07304 [Caenorhabditis briggsae]|uniref:Protein CBG07304 n=1 Tax=Caenorhabditis briggsae TaxID=6238 RepID=A8X519_CAEBR|nr:Protein CBG07304 [Caenorhabditis briggsae]CAP27729.1 Protein CBG07304 [Caenorhabditis briggsae]